MAQLSPYSPPPPLLLRNSGVPFSLLQNLPSAPYPEGDFILFLADEEVWAGGPLIVQPLMAASLQT